MAGARTHCGALEDFSGPASYVPNGWLLRYGQAVSRSTYADLFALYGTTYGVGDGSTTFNLPDDRGRVAVGLDNMGGSDAGRLSVSNTLGGTGGAETVTLSSTEMPSHTHTIDHDHANGFTNPDGAHTHSVAVGEDGGDLLDGAFVGSATGENAVGAGPTTTSSSGSHTHLMDIPAYSGSSGSAGSGGAHNNMPPYILVNKIIRT
jgi:microcystin-dependent protein